MPRKKSEKVINHQEPEFVYGAPIFEIHPPSRALYEDSNGNIYDGKKPAEILISVKFRKMLPRLKGAPLAVFISISLHVNTDGTSWPKISTICEETGYEQQAVMEAIKYLETIPGLLSVTRRLGTSNLYKPNYVSYKPRK